MSQKSLSLKGTIIAIVTPFSPDSSVVDFSSLESLTRHFLKAGVDGLVACGSTGEGATLSEGEYREVVACVARSAAGRVPVLAGVNSSSTARACEVARSLSPLGVDGVLLVAPPYNKPPQEGLYRHFAEVRAAAGMPIVAYNIPGRTAVNILPATLARMAKEQIIVGVKDSTGSLDQVVDLMSELRMAGCFESCSVLSGEDSLVVPMMSVGAKGVIAAAGNIIPEKFVAMTSAALRGDFARAGALQCEILPVVRAMFAETNPIPVKAALQLRGLIQSGSVRLPLVGAQPSTLERIKKVLGL